MKEVVSMAYAQRRRAFWMLVVWGRWDEADGGRSTLPTVERIAGGD